MKRKFAYSIPEMNRRLLAIGRPIRNYLVISTLSSIIGALSHMGLMGFGALWLLAAAGFCSGTARYAALTVLCAALIAFCRYLEGVFSHLGAYGILAKMRVHLYETIRKLEKMGIPITVGDHSNYRTEKKPVRMEYLDDIDIPEFKELPTFKRMCICILKNDHTCKYMGFSLNKAEKEQKERVMEKYKALI